MPKNRSPDVILSCLQCLEACTTGTDDSVVKDSTKLDGSYLLCANVFSSYLCRMSDSFSDPIKSKVSIR